MFKLIYLLFLYLNLIYCCDADSIEDETELLMTFMVHRHGDRTPTASTIGYTTDVEAVTKLTAKYGYGQLTDAGKKRGYHIGQFIRKRYNDLLSPYYNHSEIYIRSTDSTRTKMTALTSMAAVYPLGKDNWSSHINWTPVPYTTVPANYDPYLAIIDCPNFVTLMYQRLLAPSEQFEPYSELLDYWSELVDYNTSSITYIPLTLYDVYDSQISLGVPVPEKIMKILPQIEEVAGVAWNVTFGNEDTYAMLSGVLLNRFFTVADQVIAGEDVPRVQILSGHDFNVFALTAATKVTPFVGVVEYGALYALELRKNMDGEYIVVPVYLPDPNTGEYKYLQMDGCDGYCDLETFRNFTAGYTTDEKTWRTICDWSEDYVNDTSSFE